MPTDPAGDVVRRYLDALVHHDWTTVAECVADDVVRIGPYGDTHRGREDYVAFLADVLPRLAAYELRVARVVASDGIVVAELRESVDEGPDRLHTDEAIVFDLDAGGRIGRVAVYLRSSVREPRG